MVISAPWSKAHIPCSLTLKKYYSKYFHEIFYKNVQFSFAYIDIGYKNLLAECLRNSFGPIETVVLLDDSQKCQCFM